MGTIDITNVILAVLSLIGGCGWIVNRRKYRQEVRSLQADNRQKEMDLSKDYVTEWRTYIAEPLQREVNGLRQEVAELRYAIQQIDRCPHRDACPVIDRMQRPAAGEQ